MIIKEGPQKERSRQEKDHNFANFILIVSYCSENLPFPVGFGYWKHLNLGTQKR